MQIDNWQEIQKIKIYSLETSCREQRYILVYGNRNFEIAKSFSDLIKILQQSENYQDAIDLYKNKFNKSYTEEVLKKIVEQHLISILFNNKKTKHSFLLKKELIQFPIIRRLTSHLKFLFNAYIIGILLIIAFVLEFYFWGEYAFVEHYGTFSLCSFLELLFLLLLSSFVHELGHATACHHFGIKHGGIGVGLYLNFPVFYTDVSNIWQLTRKQRLVVNVAGVYFQLILILIVLILYTYMNDVILEYFIFLTNMNMLITLNPFFKFDGYWIISDLLGVPNLRKRTNEVLLHYWYVICRIKNNNTKPFVFKMRTKEKIFMILYVLLVNIFLGYYCFYLIPLFLYDFAKNFPFQAQQLILELATSSDLDYKLLNMVLVKLLFFICIIYLIVRLIKKYVKKHNILNNEWN